MAAEAQRREWLCPCQRKYETACFCVSGSRGREWTGTRVELYTARPATSVTNFLQPGSTPKDSMFPSLPQKHLQSSNTWAYGNILYPSHNNIALRLIMWEESWSLFFSVYHSQELWMASWPPQSRFQANPKGFIIFRIPLWSCTTTSDSTWWEAQRQLIIDKGDLSLKINLQKTFWTLPADSASTLTLYKLQMCICILKCVWAANTSSDKSKENNVCKIILLG